MCVWTVIPCTQCDPLYALSFLSRSGLMKTEVTEDDSHTTESEDTTSKSSEAGPTEPSSPSKSDLEEKRYATRQL